MSGLPEGTGPRRKRVLLACEPCRSMKSKCDGARPSCERCIGYGYQCVYSSVGRKRCKHEYRSTLAHDTQACCRLVDSLCLLIKEYDNLAATDASTNRDANGRRVRGEKLELLRQRTSRILLGSAHAGAKATSSKARPLSPQPLRSPETIVLSASRPGSTTERYLGEVSDVRFFNLVDRVLQEKSAPSPSEEPSGEPMDSYEQDGPSPQEEEAAAAARSKAAVELEKLALPEASVAERYIDIYFSTIHIAYPFIPQALFVQKYQQYAARGAAPDSVLDTCWLATLYIIFAIGAYYDTISGNTGDESHEKYFHRAVVLSDAEPPERSVGRVSFLLAQCFYLLATCRTDKCWTTLGLAVRVAQSIGLHVDVELPFKCVNYNITVGVQGPVKNDKSLLLRAETRRRVWYCIYVLDRLLALQLGRPPAIHDDDCHLQPPSRLGDGDIDWQPNSTDGRWQLSESALAATASRTATTGDYFVHMISLSQIIGRVLRDIYSPDRARSSGNDDDISDWLSSTRNIDAMLVSWKRALPRSLRFDLGHTFETNLAFRRQRNMLAIKFHHLRALIHRPYLCLPFLRRLEKGSTRDGEYTGVLSDHNKEGGLGDKPGKCSYLLETYEQTCISEAQHTAHLLHNVVDKEGLVHDFPWWQMISCLICASSILVVASVFTRKEKICCTRPGTPVVEAGSGAGEIPGEVAALEDDAETCLKVFEALSSNSEGARIARDMMRRLKTRGQHWREAHLHCQQQGQQRGQPHQNIGSVVHQDGFDLQPSAERPSMVISEALDTHNLRDMGSTPSDLGAMYVPGTSVVDYFSFDQDDGLYETQQWPSEILDSMAWSVQFCEATDSSRFHID